MADVGMNLAPVTYYSTEFPFIDRMKTAGAWGSFNGTVPLDAHGNPTAVPTENGMQYPYIQTVVGLDPVSYAMTDVYELTYSGTAAFQVLGATVISSQPGKLVFRYESSNNLATVVARAIDVNNPVHDIHIVRQDQVESFNKGAIFNSEFLDQVSNWQTLRFMDWGNVNSSTLTSWDQRSQVADLSWAGQNGVPIEIMIKLANEARTDMWFNMPTWADDTYVRNALQLIKDNLASGLKVHVEYSNEMWNVGFQQAAYGQTMANKLFGKDVNKDGVIDPNNSAEAVYDGRDVYYGYRSAQIASIANSVFSGADDSRLKMVFAKQNGNAGLEKYLVDGVSKAGLGTMSQLFDEWSVTSYFGAEIGGATTSDRTKILGWANSGQAGINAALNELAHGGAGLSLNFSVDDVAKYLVYEKTVADRYGLDLVGYEGGFHGSAVGFGGDQQTIRDFFARLMADPGMKDLYTYWWETFEKAGGKMMAAYYDVARPSVFGAFGTMDTLYDPKTPRYNALLDQATVKPPVEPSPTLSSSSAPGTPVVDGTAAQTVGATVKMAGATDFNGDGRADILWRDNSGHLSNWLGKANGGFVGNDGNAFASVPTSWKVAGTGDFNGDGRADILWRNDNGQLSNWLGQANGGFVANDANAAASVPTNWHVVGTGDFNGDGRADILWRNDNGQLSNWLGKANGGFVANDANAFASVPTSWKVVGTGDFNGDGRADILWRNDNGQLSNWLGQVNGGFVANDANASASVPTSWHVVGTGDFNGDGRTDILWRNDNGQLSNWLGQANGGFVANDANASANVPTSWHVVGTGDFNGDGRDDILWRNDNGQLSDWLGQANGGFVSNDANAFNAVALSWITQPVHDVLI